MRNISIMILVCGAIGCGDSSRMKTYPTSGSITFDDGKPVEEGTIMFVSSGLPSGRGLIEGGQYQMGTYEQADGSVEGTFQVAVVVNPPANYDPDAGPPPVGAKEKYSIPETSGLEFTVTADGPNEFDIVLERGR